jgi:hypothetical protein
MNFPDDDAGWLDSVRTRIDRVDSRLARRESVVPKRHRLNTFLMKRSRAPHGAGEDCSRIVVHDP